ncbi:MAG: trigger factor [Proteobacteria bacterium]|nr:trigger factor [Pseudomonadota bacterium]
MKVNIEDLSSVKKKIVVNFPKETVEGELKKELLKIQKTAEIKGFRKGKAPYSIVEKIYMPEAMRRYAERIIKESLESITTENKLDIATRPVIEKEDFTEAGFEYHAIIEVHPKVELNNYKNLTIKKQKLNVSEDLIEGRIKELKEQNYALEDAKEDEKSDSNSVVTFDVLEYKLDGEFIGKFDNEVVDLSKETIFSELRTALADSGMGEIKEVSFTYPEDMEDEKLRGKRAELKIMIKKIAKKVLPDENELAKKMGFEDSTLLREDIKKNIETKLSREIEDKFKVDLFNKIAEENPFEVPEGMIDELAIKMLEDFMRNLEKAGLDPSKMNLDWKNMYEANKKSAEHILKRHYILKALKEKENLEVTEDELENRVAEIIEKSQDKEKASLYLSNPNVRRNIYMDMLENKVVEFLISNNNIEMVEG